MFRIIRKSLKIGLVTGKHPAADAPVAPVEPAMKKKSKGFVARWQSGKSIPAPATPARWR